MMKKLTEKQVQEKLESLGSKWKLKKKRLTLTITAKDFNEVVGLVNKISDSAQKLDHHPDLRIFSYNNLEVTLYTHKVNGLTESDFKLAEMIDSLNTQNSW